MKTDLYTAAKCLIIRTTITFVGAIVGLLIVRGMLHPIPIIWVFIGGTYCIGVLSIVPELVNDFDNLTFIGWLKVISPFLYGTVAPFYAVKVIGLILYLTKGDRLKALKHYYLSPYSIFK